MLLDLLNLNQLRVFECVFRLESMTKAAYELHLTQSGVSQHIKALEAVLGVPLFDRIRQRLVPTRAAQDLYRRCSEGLGSIEHALSAIKDGGTKLSGRVTIGMPIEFGNNLVVPLLAEFGRKNPGVTYDLQLGFASTMNEGLLRGELDFAFVDAYGMDRRITVEKIADESLELCAAAHVFKAAGSPHKTKQDRRFYESLSYVEYEQGEPLLRMWFAHHLKQRNIHLNVRARVMDVQGIARFITAGLGAGIIPGHLFKKLQKEGVRLHRFEGAGLPLRNQISIAYLTQRTHAPASQALIEHLTASLREANWS